MLHSMKKVFSVILAVSMVLSLIPTGKALQPLTAVAAEDRNLASRRAAYHSSAFSFNETAQLVTDGIIDDIANEYKIPYDYDYQYSAQNNYSNDSRFDNPKYLFDRDANTRWVTYRTNSWVQIAFPKKVSIRSYSLTSDRETSNRDPRTWTLQGSNDGVSFVNLNSQSNQTFTSRGLTRTFTLASASVAYRYIRLNITANNGGDRIHLAEWNLFDDDGESLVMPYPENVNSFYSAWMPKGTGEEWVYVDLGEESAVNKVRIHWGSMYATVYDIQTSNDAAAWETVAGKTQGVGGVEEIILGDQNARYVRLLLKECSNDTAYLVREFEVFGTNTIEYKGEADKQPTQDGDDGTQVLSGGNWKVERDSVVDPDVSEYNADAANDDSDALGLTIASAGYDDGGWLPAIVPGTVLTSYISAGAVPDPNFGDNQLQVSDSYFKANFWYRNSFVIPKSQEGRKAWLNFDAINWKAEIYLNGNRIGNIKGAYTRAKFDISEFAKYGEENYLAVLIHRNTDGGTPEIAGNNGPGNMGGVFGNSASIGRDAPTSTASVGWDWVPAVRGRNIGIYNDVFLSYSDAIVVENPWMITSFKAKEPSEPGESNEPNEPNEPNAPNAPVTPLDLSEAFLSLETDIRNTMNQEVSFTLKGTIEGRDDVVFEEELTLAANSMMTYKFSPVKMTNPDVWWPNTYGEQPLYTAILTVTGNGVGVAKGVVTDVKTFNFGVREMSFTVDPSTDVDPNGYINGKNLTVFCNGVLIVCRGGNWGMEDINLNVDAEAYDVKIRLHKEANFTMIRNWGGQTNDREFYNACDKYGVLIWDDFFMPGCWLDNPTDVNMYLQNAEDKIKDYRSHPSLAFYCGANEMFPEILAIEQGLRNLTSTLDGTRTYFPNSGQAPSEGGGPYGTRDPKFYFNNTSPRTIKSERGLQNIPVLESLKAMMPEDKLWPINNMYALHNLAMGWNVNGQQYLNDLNHYGAYNSVEQFEMNARMMDYENFKAVFEATYNSRSNGMLLWMSQSVWPSLIWQTYDYYHDVNSGYFGAKTGNQPINFIWNPTNNYMTLINATPYNLKNLTVIAEVYDLDGKISFANSVVTNADAGSRENKFQLTFPANSTDIQFIKTRVENAEGKKIAENFYWTNTVSYQDYNQLANMKKAEVKASFARVSAEDSGSGNGASSVTNSAVDDGSIRRYRVTIENTGDAPALMIRVKVMNESTGERVLPVFYEDNYFSLTPGDVKSITLDFKEMYLDGGEPQFEIEGWNLDNSVLTENAVAYYIAMPSLTNDGVAVGSITGDGDYSASVTITAAEDANIGVSLIMAVYKSGVFVGYSIEPYQSSLSKGESVKLTTAPINIPADADLSEYVIKAFVWDANTFAPLKPATQILETTLQRARYLPRNVGLGGVATASAAESSNPPGNAVDGNTGTRWASGDSSDDHWLLVDFGKDTVFTTIRIQWEAAYARSYYIEISDDGENYTEIARKDNGAGGTDVFNFEPPLAARYVRWVGLQRGTSWGYSIYEFGLFSDFTPSIAVGSMVTASDYDPNSNDGRVVSPDKIVDGDLDTRWATMQTIDNHWLLIDLGAEKTFSSIDVIWEAAYASQYRIETSNNNIDYTLLVRKDGGTGGLNRFDFASTTARYIKITLERRGTGWGYSIWEFGLYE